MSSRALPAPSGDVVVLDTELAEQALAAARASERGRMILPFHKNHDESLHRMFNAMQPGTYVQPHRHASSGKCEAFVMLRGALDFLVFEDDGRIALARTLSAGGAEFGIDVAPTRFHSFLVRAPDTLVYELKNGPYTAMDDKDFAPWAPRESEPEACAAYMTALEQELLRLRR
jgi:cupin fold WbuC family metalloprotein